ncbi:transposase [Intestinimonas sp. MSJ-38]|uniref:transposase n=1 Tax=Intestinimonas sp. MSJ-38 TaxID=2841532 RepID=UPI0020A1F428|nr:transposase [Intestinimonas sp. MSJ-38]
METTIVERCCWESSAEKALIKMYIVGVSVWRVKNIIKAFWGTKSFPPPSMSGTRKHVFLLRIGEAVLFVTKFDS